MNIFQSDDGTLRRPLPAQPLQKPGGDDDSGGPSKPEVSRPNTRQLLERMKRVDPEQAKRYRQRSGQ